MRISDEQAKWYAEMALDGAVAGELAHDLVAERAKSRSLTVALREARTVISGLADQQAMLDDWYKSAVEKIDSALAARKED